MERHNEAFCWHLLLDTLKSNEQLLVQIDNTPFKILVLDPENSKSHQENLLFDISNTIYKSFLFM